MTLQPLFRVRHMPCTTAYVPPRVIKQAPSSLAHVDQFRRACQIRVDIAPRKRVQRRIPTARAAGVGSVPTTGVALASNLHVVLTRGRSRSGIVRGPSGHLDGLDDCGTANPTSQIATMFFSSLTIGATMDYSLYAWIRRPDQIRVRDVEGVD